MARTAKRSSKKSPVRVHKPQAVEVATSQESVVEKVVDVLVPPRMLQLKSWVFGLILMVTGSIGLLASFALTVEKIHVLKDPNYNPICNINPILSCQSVMTSSQAELYGIPNTIFGLIGFSMVIAIGAALVAGGRFHKRFWQLWMIGMAGGLVMMVYLIFQSIYRLEKLCPFCMATWAALLPMLWYSYLWAVQHDIVATPRALHRVVQFMRREHLSLLIVVYMFLIVFIVNHFWYYFKTL